MKNKKYLLLLFGLILIKSLLSVSFQFVIEPMDLGENYYDYMPGSFNAIPIQKQPDESGGGTYIIFHAKSYISSLRNIYYSYIDASGELVATEMIQSNADPYTSFPSIFIDKETGDPLWFFHGDLNNDEYLDIGFGYDQYHLYDSSGFSTTTWLALDGKDVADNPLNYVTYDYTNIDNLENDIFLWPYGFYARYNATINRAYVFCKNKSYSASGGMDYSENLLMIYGDYSKKTLSDGDTVNWQYKSFPFFDKMHINPLSERPITSFTVGKNGQIAIVGYRKGEIFSNQDPLETLETFVYFSEDFGETWNLINKNFTFDVSCIPRLENGENFINDLNESTMVMTQGATENFNAQITADGILHAAMVWKVMYRKYDTPNVVTSLPRYSLVKDLVFDFKTKELFVRDIYPTANNGKIASPWDVDGDGEIDSFNDEGIPLMNPCCPVYWWDINATNTEFYHNNIKTVICDEDPKVIAAVWQDSWKANAFWEYNDISYNNYASAPEIYIAISKDGGLTWAEPVVISSVEVPEMQNIIPEFVYPSNLSKFSTDEFEMEFLWLNDYVYGSSVFGHSSNLGGMMQYAKIRFCLDGVNDEQINEAKEFKVKIFPNPFVTSLRKSLKIEFINKKSINSIKVEIFNLKGEKIMTEQTISTSSEFNVFNYLLPSNLKSGVYFLKIKCNLQVKLVKFIVLK